MQMLFTQLCEGLGDALGRWLLFFQTSSLNLALGCPIGAERFIMALASRSVAVSSERQDELSEAFAALPLPATLAPANPSSWTLSSTRLDLELYSCVGQVWLLKRTEGLQTPKELSREAAYGQKWRFCLKVGFSWLCGRWLALVSSAASNCQLTF